MTALEAIVWAASALATIAAIYATWGNAQLVAMFPEGKRWWMPWTRLISLALFAGVVIFNPFCTLILR